MNKETYQTFRKEIEKQSSISGAIGTGVEKALHLAWENPRTTLALTAGAFTLPALLNKLFPAIILGSERIKHKEMGGQTELMKKMLFELQDKNRSRIIINQNKPIERPLV